MIDEAQNVKKEKTPATESQKIIDNHQKATMHHETAAFLYHETARYQMAGNNTMACGCNCKAKDQSDLAVKAQKKIKKKQTKIA